ncbi:hypothetical protein ACLBP9_31125, partial [Klebsiella pneumoniae]|uniref:hypothetical protein n=1 Tax=Klebsiella pneumoniae TaxID=573 RepID=UPI0039698C7B
AFPIVESLNQLEISDDLDLIVVMVSFITSVALSLKLLEVALGAAGVFSVELYLSNNYFSFICIEATSIDKSSSPNGLLRTR